MRDTLKRVFLGGLLAVAVALPLGGFAVQEANAEPATLVLRAGGGEPGYAVNEFLPENLVVTKGDTVTWEFDWFEPHSVTFGQPTGNPAAPTHPGQAVVPYTGAEFVSSGLIFGTPSAPETFSMQFNEFGTFPYVCILHPFMTGTVTVLASEFERDTQAEIDAAGDALYDQAVSELKGIANGLNAAGAAVTTRPNGTKLYDLTVGPATMMGDVMQFFPMSAAIKTGDTIRWTNGDPTPHTVTFNPQSAPPGLFDPTDPEGVFEVPPQKPAGSFDGTGLWHSGIIGAGFPDGTTFEMTFSKAGTFNYLCLLHADQGMVGAVTVSQGTSAPQAPNTGSGIAETDSASMPLIVLSAALAVAVLGGATAFAVKR